MEKVRSASQLRQTEAAKDAKRKLSKDKKRIAELDTIIKKLYESFAVGRITDERFDSLLADYEAEQKTLQASVTEAEERLSAFAEDSARVEQFLELARKYTDFSELTTPMINEFIEKIIVHAPERIDGDRVQEVEIHLRFIGQFELPAPELTEEEIKRQEFLKKERIRSRERYQKLKAGERTLSAVPVTADLQVLRAGICIQADKHPVLRPQLPRKILPAGGGREPQPGVYLRKLRQGVYNNEGRCQILR
ncbi:DUF4368 domain-containing protein [[Ruminococcus] torques]|uniref:DUF4368 domain-containing protein n=1 Tax=[Ruminococcus] torques TaxID=33039 RepID=UPI003522AEFE